MVQACEFAHKGLLAGNGRYDAVLTVLADEDTHQDRVRLRGPGIKASLVFDRSVTPW